MKPEVYDSLLLRHARWMVWTRLLSFVPAVVLALQSLGTAANKADEWLPALDKLRSEHFDDSRG